MGRLEVEVCMRTRIKPCVVSLFLAAQALALPSRPLAAWSPVRGAAGDGPVHGEGVERERAAAADNVMTAEAGDFGATVALLFLVFYAVLSLMGSGGGGRRFFGDDAPRLPKNPRKEMEQKAPGLVRGDGPRPGLLAMAKDVCGPPRP